MAKPPIPKNDVVARATEFASQKQAINVGKWIKGKNIDKVNSELNRVLKFEIAVPFVNHNKNIAHKKGGIGPGKYPVKVIQVVQKLLKQLKASAKMKGLDENKLVISEFVTNYTYSKERRAKYSSGTLTQFKIGAVVEK